MAFDEVKALQTIEKLDAAGDGDLVEALAGADDPALEARLAKAKYTAEQMKRLKAAARVMGPELCKDFKFPGEGDPEDAQDGGDDEDTEKTKAKKAADAAAAIAKSAELPADVVERLAKADAQEVRLAKAEADLAKMQHEKDRAVYIKKAADLADALPGATPDDLGEILMKTAKALAPAEQTKLEAVLAGANTLVKKSAAFQEFGSALSGDAEPMALVQAKADELRKTDTTLTPEAARAKVLKANPDLMSAINKAQDERVRKARS